MQAVTLATLATRTAIVFAAISLLATLGIGAWITVSDVPIIGAAEPNVVYTIQTQLAGSPLYGDPDEPPFDVTQYMPLFYATASAVGHLGGLSAEDAAGVMRMARGVALAFSLATLVAMGWLLTRVMGVRWSIALPAIAYVFVVVCPYPFYARPDTALALNTVLALGCVLLALQGSGRRAALAAGAAVAFGLLALASKQSGAATLGLVMICLMLTRQVRILAAGAAALVGGLAVAAWLVTSVAGAMLLKLNVVDGVNNGLDLYHAIFITFLPLVSAESVLVSASVFLTVLWASRRASPAERALAIWMPLLFLFALGTSFKIGSGPNYYTEYLLVAAAALSYAVDKLLTAQPHLGRWAAAGLAVYLTVMLPMRTIEKAYVFVYGRSEAGSLRPLRQTQFPAYRTLVADLTADLDASKGDYVLSFDRAVTLMMPGLVLAPHTELAASHDREKVSRQFQALVRDGRVRYVVFTKRDVWPDYLGVRFADSFVPFREYADQVVYRSTVAR